MRTIRRTSLALVVLASLAGLAQAQGVELLSGQKIQDSLTEPGYLRVFRFQAPGETLLNLTIVPSKKTDLAPIVDLIGPDGRIDLPEPVKGKLKVKKLALPHTGLFLLTITGGSTTGDYKLSFKLKLQKKGSDTFDVPGVIDVDVTRGTLISVTVKAARGSGVEPGIDSLVDPTETDILDRDLVTEKGGTAKLKKQLCPVFGRQDISIVDRAGAGGEAKVTIKLKLPKATVKKMGPEDLIDAGVFKVREGDGFAFMAWAKEGARSAKLKRPDGSEVELLESDPGEFELQQEFDTEGELDAVFPDGLYTLVVTRHDGLVLEFPALLRGDWPGEPEITDEGTGNTPTITWTLGDGDPTQIFYLALTTPDGEDDLYSVLLPGADRSHAVPEGPIDGDPYEIELMAISENLKVSLPGEDGGNGGGSIGKVDGSEGHSVSVTRSAGGPPLHQFYFLEARLEGTEIKDVDLRYPNGFTVDMDEDGGEWEYMDFHDEESPIGTYTFVVTFTDDVVDETHTFVVGGVFPEFQGGLTPRDGDMDTGATPLFTWPTDPGDAGYRLEVEDDTQSSVIDRSFAGSGTGSYQVQAGELMADRWYFANVSKDNGSGKRALSYATFYTGASGKVFWRPRKAREMEVGAGSVDLYVFEVFADVPGADTATLVLPDETEIALTKDGEKFELDVEYGGNEEAVMNAAYPDGFYTLKLVMTNGAECPFLYFFVGGGWPDFVSVVSPAHEATGVSRTPTVSWTYGNLADVSVLEVDIVDVPTDEDQARRLVEDTSETSVAWAGFDWTNEAQLPASTEHEIGLKTESALGRVSELISTFTTVP